MNPRNYRSENHQESYEHLAKQDVHTFLPKLGRLLITNSYYPEISVSVKDQMLIDEIVTEQQPLIIVANHAQRTDHHVMSAVLRDIPELDELTFCNTIAWAKAPYFKYPVVKSIYEFSNSWPVHREQDIRKEKGTTASVGRTFQSLKKASSSKLDTGINIAGHPEGTRNRGDWRRLLKLQKGLGHLGYSNALSRQIFREQLVQKELRGELITEEDLQKSKKMSYLLMSIAYASKKRSDRHNPVVRLGVMRERADSPDLITAEMEHILQTNLDIAYHMIDKRNLKAA